MRPPPCHQVPPPPHASSTRPPPCLSFPLLSQGAGDVTTASLPQGWEGPGAQEILLAPGTPAPKKQEMPDLLQARSVPAAAPQLRAPIPIQSRAPTAG